MSKEKDVPKLIKKRINVAIVIFFVVIITIVCYINNVDFNDLGDGFMMISD